MIRIATLGALALALTSLVAVSSAVSPAAAQGKKIPAAVIAVVDTQRVLRESAVGKDITRQIEEYSRTFQGELNRQQEALRKEEDELKRQQAVLPAEAFGQKRRDFETRALDVQRQLQGRKQQLDRVANTALNQVKQSLVPIFNDLSKEQGFNMLMEKSLTIQSSDAVEVTQQVVQRLNRAMPSLQVPPPTAQ